MSSKEILKQQKEPMRQIEAKSETSARGRARGVKKGRGRGGGGKTPNLDHVNVPGKQCQVESKFKK